MRELVWKRRKKDFKIDWFSGTGAGGQHRNKHQNCCRMTDIETSIVTTGQESRSRKQNLKAAFQRMVEKLRVHYNCLDKSKDLHVKSIDREIKPTFDQKYARTHHEVDNRVVDHVTGMKYSYSATVGQEDIGEIIEDRLRMRRY